MKDSKYIYYRSTYGQLGLTGKSGGYDVTVACKKETSDEYRVAIDVGLDKTFNTCEIPIVVTRLNALIYELTKARDALDKAVDVS